MIAVVCRFLSQTPKRTVRLTHTLQMSFSPLETMVLQAVRRFGDFNPGTLSGDAALMFIEFANMVIDEVRMHPYWDGTELDYYQHLSDVKKFQT